MLSVKSLAEYSLVRVQLIHDEVSVLLICSREYGHFIVLGQVLEAFVHVWSDGDCELGPVLKCDLEVSECVVRTRQHQLAVDERFVEVPDQSLVSRVLSEFDPLSGE